MAVLVVVSLVVHTASENESRIEIITSLTARAAIVGSIMRTTTKIVRKCMHACLCALKLHKAMVKCSHSSLQQTCLSENAACFQPMNRKSLTRAYTTFM